MWYAVLINRDENDQITGYTVAGKGSGPMTCKGENLQVPQNDDIDIDLASAEIRNIDGIDKLVIFEDPAKKVVQDRTARLAQRKLRREFGGDLIDFMSDRNDEKSLSPEQIVQLVQTFADVNMAWLNGSIMVSRTLVAGITPDGVIVTEDDKSAILAEIDANLVRLGY